MKIGALGHRDDIVFPETQLDRDPRREMLVEEKPHAR
jgi:hypothetical protein